ncbi:MAG: hypothetical protein PUG54_10540 [Firmicutes bacterium]|nr:hypothetical protein [Bacillota bacterium]
MNMRENIKEMRLEAAKERLRNKAAGEEEWRKLGMEKGNFGGGEMNNNFENLSGDLEMLYFFIRDVQDEMREQGKVDLSKMMGEIKIIRTIIADTKVDLIKCISRFFLFVGGCVCLITLKILLGM